MNTTQAQQKAFDDALVSLADRLEFGKCNIRLKTDIKRKEATFHCHLSDFSINKKKVSLDVEIFREILQICTKIPGQDFKDLPLEHDILSFIRDLGHTREITYLTDDQSILRRNKMFWHTARDNTMYTSMRCISRNEKTQVYGTILPKKLTDPTMLESKAYQTYYAFASGEKAPKPKYIRKKADSDTSLKQKHVQATKVGYQKKKERIHISHASGPGDGVDTKLKGDSNKEDDDEDELKDYANNNDDDSADNDESHDDRTESDRDEIPYPNLTNADQTEHEEEDVNERERYDDVNVNFRNEDIEIINADQGASEQLNASQLLGFKQEVEDSHVTLTPVLDTQKTEGPTQKSSVSSDFTSRLLNLDNPSPANNEIAS
nr:hypothetical protein [Tanacetum cinerariifolium]GEW63059.1 hypothetical protein [Tanacetum cinerariifolium]